MKLLMLIAALANVYSADCLAAKCMVAGVWYDYASPQCSPERYQSSESKNAIQENPSEVRRSTELPYQKNWQEVRPGVVKLCDHRHSGMSLVDACRRNEENGFGEMQSDFDMPKDIALAAKIRCSQLHENFSLQAACMRNESSGYEEWMGGSDMPEKYHNAAQAYCSEVHDSYSLLAACMRNAHREFQKKYGSQSFQKDQ